MAETNFEHSVFLFAGVIIPELENNGALEQPFLTNFEKLMQGIEPDSYAKINLLVKVIGALSWIYNLKSFQKLSIQKREHFIGQLYRFPISKIVGGLTGLKSLIFIAYYGIPVVWEEISYDGPIVKNVKSDG
jgi:hypothetical protein